MDSLLEEIDSSLSLYLPGSLINRFNEHPRGVRMDNFLREVVEKAYVVSRETGGTFDLTVKPLVDAWGFGEQRHSVVPDSDRIRSLLDLVDRSEEHTSELQSLMRHSSAVFCLQKKN